MARLHFIANASFRTKVLVPVVSVMVLLLAVSLWLIDERFKDQIHRNATEQLQTAEGVLKIRQQTQTKELFLRFNSAQDEPRFKAEATSLLAEQKALTTSEGQKTFRELLDEMIQSGVADIIVLTPGSDLGRAIAVARDPQFNPEKFSALCANSVKQAFASQPRVDTVADDGRLFDIVTLPITVGGDIVGTITFAVENSMAREFAQLMQKDNDLVLLLDGHVVDSTLRGGTETRLVPEKFSALIAQNSGSGAMREIILGDEHFWGIAGWLGSPDDAPRLGYLVLSSYEKPLQTLRATQQMILLVGFLAILFGTAVVWFLVRKITAPLRELRTVAEAVGRGDFTQRVAVHSRDECGELATAFNQMTENIEQSQAQLKQTVETLKSTQAQLIQTEKLSAVGEFVAGVAHELNNPLAAVMGFSEMLKDADVGEPHRRHLGMIFKSAQRCSKIVQSLLSFARRDQPERKPVSVNKLIEDVLEVVAYPLRTSNVNVITHLSATLPLALADGHQIQQVVLNLINNARQAIEANQPGGRITITTQADEKTIRISVQDNGPGISPENLKRIFDPFFTTKEPGKGTGLGLSLCYGLIKEHGGNITPTSAPGEGATFTIELPATCELEPAEPCASASPTRNGGGKKILVVDDEESLLQMIQDELQQAHYKIATTNNGETALRKLQQESFDLVICDMKMPGLNGQQVYERLRLENPAVCRRMIFITGDVVNESLRRFLETEKRPFLAKPFTLAELHQMVQTELAKV